MEKEQTIQDAIKNIDKNKKNIRASFVRGGATGLRQQRNIRKYSSSKKYESMKQDIKNQCNKLYPNKKFIIDNIYSDDLLIEGNLTINNNLLVLGDTTTLETDVYTTEQLIIENSDIG